MKHESLRYSPNGHGCSKIRTPSNTLVLTLVQSSDSLEFPMDFPSCGTEHFGAEEDVQVAFLKSVLANIHCKRLMLDANQSSTSQWGLGLLGLKIRPSTPYTVFSCDCAHPLLGRRSHQL